MVFSTSNDFTQDLGRHLKLGELIIKTKNIPKINLFSYTNPNFPFLNHHWLSEVIFFLLSQIFGLNSLIILKLCLIFFSLAVVFKLALTKSSFVSAVLAGLVLSPLILERNGIRPEIFGYFFFSIILYILFTYPKNKKLIYFLPLIMVLWINIHISFVFGIFSILLLIIKACLPDLRGQARLVRIDQKITFFLIFSLAILFVNPHGLKGVFYPFNIFQNYGYTIVENQSLFYLSQATFNPLIKYFFFISPLIVISLIILIFFQTFNERIIVVDFFYVNNIADSSSTLFYFSCYTSSVPIY